MTFVWIFIINIQLNFIGNIVRLQQLQKIDAIQFLRLCAIKKCNIDRSSVCIKILRCAKIVYSDRP